MKITEKATDKILVRAYTNSEWDNCNFAIIHINDKWKDRMRKRIKLITPIASEDKAFAAVQYYDTSVHFYHEEEEWLDTILGSRYWSFVELDDAEEKDFPVPENRLNIYRLSLFSNGVLMYAAWGKHTQEEFFTEELILSEILSKE